MSDFVSLKEQYDALCEQSATIDPKVWSRKGNESSQVHSKSALAKCEKNDTEYHRKALKIKLDKFKEKVEAAKKSEEEWMSGRQSLADCLLTFKSQCADADFPKDNTSLVNAKKIIEDAVEPWKPDAETQLVSEFVSRTNLDTILKKFKAFTNSLEKAKKQPAFKPKLLDASKVIQFLKEASPVLQRVSALASTDGLVSKLERWQVLMEEAKQTALKNEKYDCGELKAILDYFKSKYKAATPKDSAVAETEDKRGKCQGEHCEKPNNAVLLAKGLCFNCLNEDDEFQKRLHMYQYNANEYEDYANEEQKEEFETGIIKENSQGHSELVQSSIQDQFNDAYEAFEHKKGKKGSYQKLCKALDRAEQFFATMDIPKEGESDDEEQESDEEGEFVSLGSEDEDEEEEDSDEEEEVVADPKSGRKRGRELDLIQEHDEFTGDLIRAMCIGKEEHRESIQKVYQSGDRKQLKQCIDQIIKENTRHYRVVMLRADGTLISPDLQTFLDVRGESKFMDYARAEKAGQELLSLLKDNEYKFRIDEIKPKNE